MFRHCKYKNYQIGVASNWVKFNPSLNLSNIRPPNNLLLNSYFENLIMMLKLKFKQLIDDIDTRLLDLDQTGRPNLNNIELGRNLVF